MTEQVNFGSAADPAGDAAKAAHVAAMIAKSDATAAAAAAAARPTTGTTAEPTANELIGGKFKTQDDLLAAYKALETKLGAPKTDPAAPAAAAVEPAKDPLKIEPAAADKVVADAGFKMEDLATEFAANGELKPETYEKLAKGGIPKEMVSAYIAGQQALAVQTRNEVLTSAGIKGEQDFASVTEWAAKNMTADQIEAYNKSVGPGASKATMQMAVEALYGRYTRANGSNPTLLNGQQSGQRGGDSYQSQAQWLAEVKDPRYAKDPAFRSAVMNKLSRSNI